MNAHTTTSFHFFLAHAGPDKNIAELLYDRLTQTSNVFLDSKSLTLGDDWDAAIASAQRASLVTVVLISSNTEAAYYQREEIAAAIDLARSNSGHRVVPIYLSSDARKSKNVPYGLRLKHGITLAAVGGGQEADGFSFEQMVRSLNNLRVQLTQKNVNQPHVLTRKFNHPAQCPMCGMPEVDRLESVSVDQFDELDAGWAVGGNVRLHYCGHNKCRNCGTVFDDIQHAIPIHYPSLKCPECGKARHLRCRIKHVKKDNQYFVFQAVLRCTYCGLAKQMQRVLKAFWHALSITVIFGSTFDEKKQSTDVSE